MKHSFKGLLCDLDDTLCNSSECYSLGYTAMYKRLESRLSYSSDKIVEAVKNGKQINQERLKGKASMHARILYLHAGIELLSGRSDIELAYNAAEIFNTTVIDNLTLFPGARAYLTYMRENGVRICLITNQRTEIQTLKLRKLNLSNLLDYVVTSEEAGIEKPASRIFKIALNKLSFRAEECACIGDNRTADMVGANDSGVKTLFYKCEKSKQNPNPCDIKVHTFSSFIKLLSESKKA